MFFSVVSTSSAAWHLEQTTAGSDIAAIDLANEYKTQHGTRIISVAVGDNNVSPDSVSQMASNSAFYFFSHSTHQDAANAVASCFTI